MSHPFLSVFRVGILRLREAPVLQHGLPAASREPLIDKKVAWVGKTEEELKEAGIKFKKGASVLRVPSAEKRFYFDTRSHKIAACSGE